MEHLDNISHFFRMLRLLPRPAKRGIVLVIDTFFCVLTVWLAFVLRLDTFASFAGVASLPMIVSIFVAIPIFIHSGLYRAIFRYNGLPAMMSVVRAIFIYTLIFSSIFTFYGIHGVPRAIGLIQPLLLLFCIGASRMGARIWLGNMRLGNTENSKLPQVLIYGAGNAGTQLASALVNSSEMQVLGFLDDDNNLHGNVLNGLPIYNPADLFNILSNTSVTDVLLAIPSTSRQRRNEILRSLSNHKVAVRTLPGLNDIASGKVSVSDLRELDIDDLLAREPVQPDESLMKKNVYNKVVLVTGAGGSIGSELCRQILHVGPAKLILVDHSEFALYSIHQELEMKYINNKMKSCITDHNCSDSAILDFAVSKSSVLVPLLASTLDETRMREIMSTWKPDSVYHSAAYKHVPLVEHNPIEGINNNVLGTLRTALAAADSNVTNFVLISTDKAVRPTNIMGASKRLAEMILQALDAKKKENYSNNTCLSTQSLTTFSMVRFGNVLGSSGSVVPKFRQQIRDGGPITLTHPDITRYFMTIPEAAQLVIQAGAMAKGGEVFVLDMGEPVKILDLAKRLVELSGLTVKNVENPEGEIVIEISGLRPGEKLYEELLIGDNPERTNHPRIMKAHEKFIGWNDLEAKLDDLKSALISHNIGAIRFLLISLLKDYTPSNEIVDWVYLEQMKVSREQV